MSQAEENFFTREMVYKAEWTQKEIQKVVAYVALEKKPKVEKIKKPGTLKRPRGKKPLKKQQVIHLHQSLGHIHPDKVKDLVKRTKMWNKNTLNAIDDLGVKHVQLNVAKCQTQRKQDPRPLATTTS